MIDAIPPKVKKLSDKADDLLALNIDTYDRLVAYNAIGLKQTALDLPIKGCSIGSVKFMPDEDNNLTSASPAFWSATLIGISYTALPISVPPQTGSGTISSYRTYDLSTNILSASTALSVATTAKAGWYNPIRKYSAGYLVSGLDTLGRGKLYKYNSTFGSKSDVALTLNKDISKVPWWFDSDVIYFSYFQSVAGLNDVTIPCLTTQGYDMTGATSGSAVNMAYHPSIDSDNSGYPRGTLKYKTYYLQQRSMFGKNCLIVTNTADGQLYYLPTEMMTMFGIRGCSTTFSPLDSYSLGIRKSAGVLYDMFVDTSIHLLGVQYNTNTVVYMRFDFL